MECIAAHTEIILSKAPLFLSRIMDGQNWERSPLSDAFQTIVLFVPVSLILLSFPFTRPPRINFHLKCLSKIWSMPLPFYPSIPLEASSMSEKVENRIMNITNLLNLLFSLVPSKRYRRNVLRSSCQTLPWTARYGITSKDEVENPI